MGSRRCGDGSDVARPVDRVARGRASPQEVLETQDRFDNYILHGPQWREARGGGNAADSE